MLTSGPVSETVVDAVSWELFRASGDKDEVTLKTGVDNLADDLLVREADDQAVLRSVAEKTVRTRLQSRNIAFNVLLVLRLGHQPLARIVIGRALAPATVLDLETREVRVGLDLLDERHLRTETESVPERTSSKSVHSHPSSLAQISRHQDSLECDWCLCGVYRHDSGRYSP